MKTRSLCSQRIFLADHDRQQRIVSQIIVIVDVLVAQGERVDTLSDQFFGGVFDQLRIAMIGEACCELTDDAGDAFCLAQQQTARVG